jgi:hypothetical protein
LFVVTPGASGGLLVVSVLGRIAGFPAPDDGVSEELELEFDFEEDQDGRAAQEGSEGSDDVEGIAARQDWSWDLASGSNITYGTPNDAAIVARKKIRRLKKPNMVFLAAAEMLLTIPAGRPPPAGSRDAERLLRWLPAWIIDQVGSATLESWLVSEKPVLQVRSHRIRESLNLAQLGEDARVSW